MSGLDELPRDDTGRITSSYEPTPLEVEVARQAICREFGNNGTDGYYIRILKAIAAARAAVTPADVGEEPVAWTSPEQIAELKKTRFALITGQQHDEVNLSDPFDMPFNEPLYSATALERVVRDRDEARTKIGKLEDDLSEASYEPWPEWASKVLAVIRKRSGYDGYDDAADGVDLPIELDEAMGELEAEADRQKLRAESAEAKLAEARKVIERFAKARYMGANAFNRADLSDEDFRAARRFLEEMK